MSVYSPALRAHTGVPDPRLAPSLIHAPGKKRATDNDGIAFIDRGQVHPHGTAARSGDRFGHAACVAGVVMMVSNSTGVNLPSRS